MRLVPLAKVAIDVGQRLEVGRTPFGSRLIGEISGARWEGERFRAKMVGAAAADWAVQGEDDLLAIDVRMTLQTDDGALVYVHYDGVLDGRADPPVRSAMRFETADPRYAWLVRTVFIGVGTWDGAQVRYEVFEVKP
jgi:hypothetical protein